MPITIPCPTCGATLPVPDEFAGRTVRCGACTTVLHVPAAGSPPPASAASLPPPAPPPLARAVRPAAAAAAPPRRRPRDEDEDDRPWTPRRPPPARPAVLTAAARTWLTLLAAASVVGVGAVGYAAVGGSARPQLSSPTPAPPFVAAPQPAPLPPWNEPPPVAAIPDPGWIGEPPPPVPPRRPGPRFDPGPAAPSPFEPNGNALLRRFAGRVRVSASSEWQGWPAGKAVDGDDATSWFPTGHGGNAWVGVTFPEDAAVRRVTVLGNREPQWPGYGVARGRVELLDAGGRVLHAFTGPGVGRYYDFNVPVPGGRAGVRVVRFTCLQPAGPGGVGVGEIQVE